MKPQVNTARHSRQPNSSPSRFLRVLRAFAVKVQPRIHREAAKSAKISRRKILSCQQRIFGLVVQMNTDKYESVFICGSIRSLGCGWAQALFFRDGAFSLSETSDSFTNPDFLASCRAALRCRCIASRAASALRALIF